MIAKEEGAGSVLYVHGSGKLLISLIQALIHPAVRHSFHLLGCYELVSMDLTT